MNETSLNIMEVEPACTAVNQASGHQCSYSGGGRIRRVYGDLERSSGTWKRLGTLYFCGAAIYDASNLHAERTTPRAYSTGFVLRGTDDFYPVNVGRR
jgi:hypothetical protein